METASNLTIPAFMNSPIIAVNKKIKNLREKGVNKTADDLKNTIIPREKKYLKLYSN